MRWDDGGASGFLDDAWTTQRLPDRKFFSSEYWPYRRPYRSFSLAVGAAILLLAGLTLDGKFLHGSFGPSTKFDHFDVTIPRHESE